MAQNKVNNFDDSGAECGSRVESETSNPFLAVAEDVVLGDGVKLSKFINLYGCSIGDATKIGAFVEVQKNARIGSHCKISSHSFICEGVTIEDNVFVGHGVTFVNDRYPRATAANGQLQTEADWRVEPTTVRKGASIGSGATILSNLEIGENAIVGAGCVVTKNVPPDTVVAGNPARVLRRLSTVGGVMDGHPAKGQSVDFVDLVTPHLELEKDLMDVVRRTLRGAAFIGGPMVEEFEAAFAQFCDTTCSIGVSSGTDALRFALMASGVQPGDVVVTVPHTFIATTEAISQAGAFAEFVDIDERTCNISADALEQYLKEQCDQLSSGSLVSRRSGCPVTAIVPVHLYGQMADMDRILNLAERYNLTVVEDACQAHGAQYYSKRHGRWMKAGSMGRAAAFSFYPGKNLGACGEGGAVTTNDPAVAGTVRMLRDHGQAKKYHHEIEGYNGRLDAIQAGLLRVKLDHLEKWNEQRRERADEYNRQLASLQNLVLPYEPEWSRSVYHLYVIRTSERAALQEHLKRDGIGTGIHYPVPLHLQKAYSSMGYSASDFPVATRVAAEVLSLPMFPHLTAEHQARVADSIRSFMADSWSRRKQSHLRNADIAEMSASSAPRLKVV